MVKIYEKFLFVGYFFNLLTISVLKKYFYYLTKIIEPVGIFYIFG